jgi:protein-S-isoprenylcysteine O-methyltransferase Ste14
VRSSSSSVSDAGRAPDASAPGALPSSAVDFRAGLVGLGFLICAVALLHRRPLSTELRVLALAAAVLVPIAIVDFAVLKVHRRASTGLDWSRRFQLDVRRVLTKLLGLGVTLGAIAFVYWIFPEYRGGFFDRYFGTLARLAAPLSVVAVVYVAFVDGRMRAPRDAYWQLGRLALGRFRDVRGPDIAAHARAWLVKGFFLPLMVVYMYGSTSKILEFDLTGATWANLRLYDFLYDAAFLIDLTFAVVGYAWSLKLADTHVRSAEPTMFGWVVALFCYQPFFSVFDSHYVTYGGPGFGRWLAPWPAVRAIWAGAILVLVAVYVIATVAFGLRFSNLTHRGVLTSGPYRFTKHPAYLSKNLSWWMSSVPFAVAGGSEALRHCVLLLCLNFIYFLRARTEERHLSQDPAYVAYALWMNEHGVLSFLGRWFPVLRYQPPSPVARVVPMASPGSPRSAA